MLRAARGGSSSSTISLTDADGVIRGRFSPDESLVRNTAGEPIATLRASQSRVDFLDPNAAEPRLYAEQSSNGMFHFFRMNNAGEFAYDGCEFAPLTVPGRAAPQDAAPSLIAPSNDPTRRSTALPSGIAPSSDAPSVAGHGKAEGDVTTFQRKPLRIKFKRMQVLNTGELVLYLDFFRNVTSHYVRARFNQQTAARNSSLISSTGNEYQLMHATGILIYDGILYDGTDLDLTEPTSVVLRFKGAKPEQVIPATTTFTLDLQVETLSVPTGHVGIFSYREDGAMNVHFEGIR